MRVAAALSLVLVLPWGVVGCAGSPGKERTGEPALTLSAQDSAARAADARIARAIAETRAARASGDARHFDAALQALDEARALEPARARVDLIEAWVRLGRHEFATAERLALAQLELDSGNPDAWALLGDARLELGRYEAAGDAYDRLLALRPGSASYVRAAHFRQAAGDLDGAARLYALALDTSDRRDAEGRAWLLVQRAAFELARDEPDGASASLEAALRAVPGYHSALAALAELELRRGNAEAALAAADRALAAAPHAERHLLRADALRARPRSRGARRRGRLRARRAREPRARRQREQPARRLLPRSPAKARTRARDRSRRGRAPARRAHARAPGPRAGSERARRGSARGARAHARLELMRRYSLLLRLADRSAAPTCVVTSSRRAKRHLRSAQRT